MCTLSQEKISIDKIGWVPSLYINRRDYKTWMRSNFGEYAGASVRNLELRLIVGWVHMPGHSMLMDC